MKKLMIWILFFITVPLFAQFNAGYFKKSTSSGLDSASVKNIISDTAAVKKDKSDTTNSNGYTTVYQNSLKIAKTSLLRVVKTSNEVVNNSTTLQDDDELTVSVEASKTYIFTIFCWLGTAGTGGFRFQLSVPSGGIADGTCFGTTSSGNAFQSIYIAGNSAATGFTTYSTNTGEPFVVIRGAFINSTNAGSFTLQWAQSSADATNSTVAAYSWIELIKKN